MQKGSSVSSSVIRRLPRYHRFLGDLRRSGVSKISSRELSLKMGLTASQIRQDLNCFGGFGQQGYGYNVEQLYHEIANILGLEEQYKAILIGAGNLGRAITIHMNFETKGFQLTGIFDVDQKVVGSQIGGLTVEHIDQLETFCAKQKPHIAVLCIPKEASREIAERLVKLGVKGFWNFSHYDIAVEHEDIAVENVHLGDSLMTLCYKVHDICGGQNK